MKRIRLVLIALLAVFAGVWAAYAQGGQPLILILDANGPISPPMAEYIGRGIQAAEQRRAEALIVQLEARVKQLKPGWKSRSS